VLTSPAVAAVLLRRVAALGGERGAGDGPALTRRERQIVGLIGRGLSNKEIAGTLRIELPTVKNHVHNILEKLRVERRAEAVSVARARGELDGI
jgi:ATP/maltotriose-dependent transcriptional regulator MalT